jgi:4-amino-4-deoxy-L-arabinose transferase-like glycosyltransferase
MNNFIKKETMILVGIFLLALFLRLVYLDRVPYGFHVDELDAGYVGRYILLHGKDIFGNSWPLSFDRFGDYRPTGIFYLSGLSTFIFGINEFAVRFPTVLIGALTIFPAYYFTNSLIKNKATSILSALILSILPWHIILSRATSEAIIGFFFVILGMGFLLNGVKKDNSNLVLLGTFNLLISYLFYHSFRLLCPLILIPYILFPDISHKIRKLLLGSLLLVFLLTMIFTFSKSGGGRFNQVAFFNNPTLSNTTESLISGDKDINLLLTRSIHNKIVIFSREFAKQYFGFLSPQFLIFDWWYPKRYFIPEQGLIFFSFFILLIAGSVTLSKSEISKWGKYCIIYFLICSIIPAALTYEDSPNINRSIFLILPLIMLISLGIFNLYVYLKSSKTYKAIIPMILFSIVLEFLYFSHQYFVHASSSISFLRNDGNREIVKLIQLKKSNYSKVYMSGLDYLPFYYLFYQKNFNISFDPNIKVNYKNMSIDNVIFTDKLCPSELFKLDIIQEKKTLIVDNGDCQEKTDLKELEIIWRKDSTKAYKLLTPR